MEAYATSILLVTGALTASLAIGVVAPEVMLRAMLGAESAAPPMVLLARYCSLLIALVGALLIYAAYHVECRQPVMVVAAIEKFGFGGLILTSSLRKRPMSAFFAGADTVMAILYVALLASAR